MPNVFSKLPFLMSDEDEIDTRYAKCQMYLLRHKDDIFNENVYVGHTINKYDRNKAHKSRSKLVDKYPCKVYKYVNDTGGYENWEMIMLEIHPCKNKNEGKKRELYWIDFYKSNLNSDVPNRTTMEWYYETNYNQTHKTQIEVRRSKKVRCECGLEMRFSCLTKHKKTKKHFERMKSLQIT